MRIQFILPDDTCDLRSRVLRPGRPLDECRYPDDTVPGAFHLGAFDGARLVGIASFSPENIDGTHNAFRLRGMAVEPELQGRGIGAQIIGFALSHLASLGCDVLWCNARTGAASFYRRLGFDTFSEEFDIPGIGPHYKMKRTVQRTV